MELITLVGRRERITHSEICKKVKDDLSGLLKPWIQDVPSHMKDAISSVSLESLHRLLPFYGLVSEDFTNSLLSDAYLVIKKSLKPLQDKFSSDGDILPSDKLLDFFKSQPDLKTSLSHDQLDILRARYLETKKAAVKSSSLVIYFNLKKLIEDCEAAARSLNKTPSIVKTTTPVP